MNRDNTLVRIMNGREIHPCTLDRGTEGMKTAFGGGLCVPYTICEWMPEAVDGVALCDPKGAGVSTTSQRYSRKEYRQTFSFRVLLSTFSFQSIFFGLPGVFTTIISNS